MVLSLSPVAFGAALVALHANSATAKLCMTLVLAASAFAFTKLRQLYKPNAQATLQGQVLQPSSEQELQVLLEAGGINTSNYGMQNSKSLSSLFSEVQKGKCSLDRGCITGRLTRRVEPVFVVLTFGNKILIETSQELSDGRTRERNMLLAKKLRPSDHNPKDAALRGLMQELQIEGISGELPAGICHCKTKDACFVEEREAASYPGLPCVYLNHQVHIDIDAAAARFFHKCGLPLCTPFETMEEQNGGSVRHFWDWLDASEAKKRRVTGLLFQN